MFTLRLAAALALTWAEERRRERQASWEKGNYGEEKTVEVTVVGGGLVGGNDGEERRF